MCHAVASLYTYILIYQKLRDGPCVKSHTFFHINQIVLCITSFESAGESAGSAMTVVLLLIRTNPNRNTIKGTMFTVYVIAGSIKAQYWCVDSSLLDIIRN